MKASNKICFAIMALAVAGLLGTTAPTQASVILEFDDTNQAGGTVEYDGAGGALVGTNIIFNQIRGFGTPANDGQRLRIQGGRLNFESGPNTSEGPAQWTFAGGGTFELTGTARLPNNQGGAVIATGTLLSGSFSNAQVTQFGNVLFAIGTGTDEKNQDLLDYYGILSPSSFTFAQTEISFEDVTVGSDGSFSGTVSNADLVNTQTPEPNSLLVWGLLTSVAIYVSGAPAVRGRRMVPDRVPA